MDFNYFEVHLVDHCNLNCQCCDNFSPLAEEHFVEKESFTNDFKQLSNLDSNGKIKSMRLLGGEPLLHPYINYFLKTSRKYFPDADIRLTTNGINLATMPKAFWETCKENAIIIEITYYPIKINKGLIKELAEIYGVTVVPFDRTDRIIKTSYRNPIRAKKVGDPKENYKRCYQRGRCMSLKEGKIYPCTCIPNICHFNKYFKKNLEVTKQDSIDIYKVGSFEEIEKFLDTEVPFCAYCDIQGRTRGKTWRTSKKEIGEWLNN